ncbi:DNase1 protein [Beauveria brongniartii RCEF 3172]|uniref:DNase1 protein n=1 Tax=Beauveria brongniartii RCEF 3172 TaxID=1081107 RepID=A0A162JKX0_9HYPO|nr:DNase1 protein [Beauveria brongniartii RCEF 3172]
MHFSKTLIGLAASSAAVSAASVRFWTLDTTERTIYFVPSPGSPQMAPVTVNNNEKTKVEFDDGFTGMFYAVPKDAENKDGIIGEVRFGGDEGKTFFDVSAIDHPEDHDNIKQMYPVDEEGNALLEGPMSGCVVHPCDNVYKQPDDVQTKVTKSTDLMTTLGSGDPGLTFAS